MSDKYVRVQAETPIRGYFHGDGAKEYVPNIDGELKVVPADAIVIEESELPTVVVGKHLIAGPIVHTPGDATDHYRVALAHLALAEYLEAHPPVDEAQVETLTDLVRAIGGPTLGGGSTPLPEDFARRLIERGVRIDIPKEQP